MDTPVYEYVSTRQDYEDAQRLHRRNNGRAALRYYLIFWAVPVLGALFVLTTASLWAYKGFHAARPLLLGAGVALYFSLLFPFSLWNAKRKAWKRIQAQKPNNEPVTVQFDDHQIISAIPGVSDGRFFWSAIKDYAEDDRLALLYPRPQIFIFVPKRAMPSSEWDRLRAHALPQKRKT